MAGARQSYHEPLDKLAPITPDLHRALVSLQEELEAIDWYRQRSDATDSESLKGVLLHNMKEEIEHACMVLEWIRRHEPLFDTFLRTYLFKETPITAIEDAEDHGNGKGEAPTQEQHPNPMRLTVGTMKGAEDGLSQSSGSSSQ